MKLRIAALAALVPSLVAGQSRVESPEDIARRFFQAEREGRWREAAQLLDLTRFDTLRQQDVRDYRLQPRRFRFTPQQMMEMDPGMPLAIAEYQARRTNEQIAKRDTDGLYDYADVPNADSLEKLSVIEAAARWLQAKDPRYQLKRFEEDRPKNCPPAAFDASSFTPRPVRVIGSVQETNPAARQSAVSYVLFSDSVGSWPRASQSLLKYDSPGVLILVRSNDAWRIGPSSAFVHGTTVGFACDITPIKFVPGDL